MDVKVSYTNGAWLRVHTQPNTWSPVSNYVAPEANLYSTYQCENDSSPVFGDVTWDYVRTPAGTWGWVTDYYTNSPYAVNARLGVQYGHWCDG